MKRRMVVALLTLIICVSTPAQDILKLLNQFDNDSEVVVANQFFDEHWAAEWYYDQQQFVQAEQYALKALPKYHPSNPEKADCLNTLGCIYVRMGNMKQAVHYAKQSVEMEMLGGDDDRISSSLNTLAGIYMAANQAEEAKSIILQALEHANRVDNPERKAVILGMASEIYHTLGDDNKALPYAEEAVKIEKQLGRKPKLAIRLSQKGSALLGLHRYKEAEDIYRQILPDLKESGMGDLYNEIHSHRGLYESYWTINPDSAKIELDYFNLLKDSLYSHSTAETLSRYNAEFGNDLLLKENNEVKQAHRRTIIFAIIAILLIVFVAIFIIRRIRSHQQQQMQELIHEIEQLRLSRDETVQPITETTEETVNSQENVASSLQMELTEERLFLMRVIEVVNTVMPSGNLSVEQIASELNMSVQTFRRRLQEAAGETPKAYIQAIQMERAAQLLANRPDMLVSQVANLSGFDETSSFSHTFKRIYGCSPTQYRDSK